MENGFKQACQRVTLAVLAKRKWGLVSQLDDFVAQVAAEAEDLRKTINKQQGLPEIIGRAVVRCYSQLLYAACREHGSLRQGRAFEELAAYIYRITLYQLHDASLAEEYTQQSLLKVWEKRDQCRQPFCFLRWVASIAIHEYGAFFRRKSREVEPANEEVLLNQPVHAQSNQSPRMNSTVRSRLIQAIQACIPRSQAQQAVIVEIFLNGRSFKENAAPRCAGRCLRAHVCGCGARLA